MVHGKYIKCHQLSQAMDEKIQEAHFPPKVHSSTFLIRLKVKWLCWLCHQRKLTLLICGLGRGKRRGLPASRAESLRSLQGPRVQPSLSQSLLSTDEVLGRSPNASFQCCCRSPKVGHPESKQNPGATGQK